MPNHIVAIVLVSPDAPELDRLRYLPNYFATGPDPAFDTTRVTKSLRSLCAAGTDPS